MSSLEMDKLLDYNNARVIELFKVVFALPSAPPPTRHVPSKMNG